MTACNPYSAMPDDIAELFTVHRMPDNPWKSSGGITELEIDDIIS